MKLRMNVCFVSLAKPCSVPHFLRGCSRQVLCFWEVLCETRENPAELIEANGIYAVIRHRDGQESTVSTFDLAPYRDHMKSKPNVLLRRLPSKTPRLLKHSTPTQLTTVIPARHHVTLNLKCPTTSCQRRTVIRLYPRCDVQHDSDDPLTITGMDGLTGSIYPCAFICWGDCEEFAPLERRLVIDGAALIRSWRVTVLFCDSQSWNDAQLLSGLLTFIYSSLIIVSLLVLFRCVEDQLIKT